MGIRKIRADQIFDGYRLHRDQMLVLRDGRFEAMVKDDGTAESLEGILLPGFINSHCHLELSHFRNEIPEGSGLVDFLLSVVRKRKEWSGEKERFIADADAEMFRNGIDSVIDICNTTDAIEIKKKSPIHYRSLMEVIHVYGKGLDERWSASELVLAAHTEGGLACDFTPHAPYSVSPETFARINSCTEDTARSSCLCTTLSRWRKIFSLP
jgi:cytosine/adenosine deaminase-related metal-dependent hydrolase